MTREQLEKGLAKYIPLPAVPLLAQWVIEFGAHLRITKARNSKLGDYRHPYAGEGHRITVNHNLNPYSFLITLVHEMAHLTTWNKYRNKVSPHGAEWKNEYKILMREVVRLKVFPQDIYDALVAYMQNPAASSCSDEDLLRTLRKYDTNKEFEHLEELPDNSLFALDNGMVMRKGPKSRKRYKCYEVNLRRYYMVSPLAEVKRLEE
jgi:SprT protein